MSKSIDLKEKNIKCGNKMLDYTERVFSDIWNSPGGSEHVEMDVAQKKTSFFQFWAGSYRKAVGGFCSPSGNVL